MTKSNLNKEISIMFTSGFEPVPVGGTNVPAVILDACRVHPGDTALLDDCTDRRLSYAELAHQIDRIGAALADRGYAKGDVIAIWAPNQPEWMSAALGAMAAGCTVTAVSPPASDAEVEMQLETTGASMLVTGQSLAERAAKVGVACSVDEVVVLSGTSDGEPHVTPLSRLLNSDGASPDIRAIDDDDIALLPMSSGTTGKPKQVEITHGAVVTMFRQISAAMPIDHRDRVLALPSFAHPMGSVLTGSWPLSQGACVVTTPKFNPERFLPAITDRKLTMVVVPPLLAGLLASHPGATTEALASVRLLGFGGAPSAPDLLRKVAHRFPQAVVGQGYGMTELTCVATTVQADDPGPVGSAGRLVANTELRVVDPATGSDLAVNEEGELWIRGPQLMAGYRDNPEMTQETIDSNGWLHTGDLGRIDEAGNVFVVDRLKELIKVKGYQVAPAELEQVLLGHRSVTDAGVTSIDVGHDERPVAFVVSAGSEIDVDDVLAHVSERVAYYKRPVEVHVVDAIPRNNNGKILRRELKAQLA